MAAQGRKKGHSARSYPDHIDTLETYPLVFVENSLTQTNLLRQQHLIATKPGLHDREQVFKAVDDPSKATKESEKEAKAYRNINKIRQLRLFVFGISCIAPPLELPPNTENQNVNSW